MLADAGLNEADLLTTPGRPRSRKADSDLILRGDTTKRPILHNCSGKHAGWLAACVTAGWDSGTYLDPDHPLQEAILNVAREFTDTEPTPTGIDGCGAPTLRGTLHGLATGFRRLDTDAELRPIRDAMARFPGLISDNLDHDGRVGAVFGGPQKGGAAGSYGMARQGIGIATKSMSGSFRNSVVAALHVADRLSMVTPGMREALKPQFAPAVVGGGQRVGTLEVAEW